MQKFKQIDHQFVGHNKIFLDSVQQGHSFIHKNKQTYTYVLKILCKQMHFPLMKAKYKREILVMYIKRSIFLFLHFIIMFPLSKCEINKFLFVIFQIDITSLAITPVVNYMPVEGRKTNPRSRGGQFFLCLRGHTLRQHFFADF